MKGCAMILALLLLFGVFGIGVLRGKIEVPGPNPDQTQEPEEPDQTQEPEEPDQTQEPEEPDQTQEPEEPDWTMPDFSGTQISFELDGVSYVVPWDTTWREFSEENPNVVCLNGDSFVYRYDSSLSECVASGNAYESPDDIIDNGSKYDFIDAPDLSGSTDSTNISFCLADVWYSVSKDMTWREFAELYGVVRIFDSSSYVYSAVGGYNLCVESDSGYPSPDDVIQNKAVYRFVSVPTWV